MLIGSYTTLLVQNAVIQFNAGFCYNSYPQSEGEAEIQGVNCKTGVYLHLDGWYIELWHSVGECGTVIWCGLCNQEQEIY